MDKRERENELCRRAQAGDREAGEVMLLQYHRLIHQLANRYYHAGLAFTYEEFTNAAKVGLWAAMLKFKPERGHRFNTYAYKCIFGELMTMARYEGTPVWAGRYDTETGRVFRENMARIASLQAFIGEDGRRLQDILSGASLGTEGELDRLDVEEAFDALSEEHKDALVCWLSGGNMTKAGEKEGLCSSTIANRKADAVKRMRERLRSHGIGVQP